MNEKETKPVNRYTLMLEITSPEGEITVYNYYEFMEHFNVKMDGVYAKMPLAGIDKFTTQYENEEQFDMAHRNFFVTDYPRPQFILLTNLKPEECYFSLHIEYKPNYRANSDAPEMKCLDAVFGNNGYLKEFLENNSARAEYSWNRVMYIVWQFYKQLENSDFYNFAKERISGFQKHNRYTDSDSRLLEQIEYCHNAFYEGKKFEVMKLEKLTRYKSFRAITMIMAEFEKKQKEDAMERFLNHL